MFFCLLPSCMKKNNFLFVLISLVVFPSILLAQTPGYMGKRFVMGYGFHTSPALIGSTGQGNTIIGKAEGNASDGEFAFNSLHEGYLEYALSKRFSLGFSAKFYKATYDNHKNMNAYVVYNGSNVSYSNSPEGLYHIKGQNYALYGKLFRRGFIAPWGKYMMFGINIKRFTCSYDPAEMQLKYDAYSFFGNEKYPSITDFGPREQSFTRFDFLFGLGKSRIVYNRIILDYGFNVNLFALLNTPFDALTDDDGLFTDYRPTNYNYIKDTSPWRVRGVNRFNAYLRIGVLLF